MKRPPLWILGFLVLLIVLLTRTWGIHVDENQYFQYAIGHPAGDSFSTGKPPLFYVLNYVVYHALRAPVGWLHPLILPIFYIAWTNVALWRLARASAAVGAAPGTVFVLLLLSPLLLFNATQVMMEAALLPALTFTVASLLTMVGGGQGPWMMAELFLAASAGALVKETALPALILLAAAGAPLLRRRVWPIIAGALCGTLLNRSLLWIIHPRDPVTYGGLPQLMTAAVDPASWSRIPAYLWLWMFF